MTTCTEVISQSGIKFGTSGARGLVVDFNEKVCNAFMTSFLNVISSDSEIDTIAFGIDNRPSSYRIFEYCASVARAHGVKVEYHGVLPTPALANYAMGKSLPCVMVTGSHIPFNRNGLKFYRPDGEITKFDEQAILNCSKKITKTSKHMFQVQTEAADFYVKRYLDFFDNEILKGLYIGFYEHSSSGRDLYPEIFERLGAKVTSIEPSDVFVPIDTEAVSDEDKKRAFNWNVEYGFDAIFSTDGDGDRPLVANEKGEWLKGDTLCLLASMGLKLEHLVFPVSCNSAIELSNQFESCTRTKIGSPYIVEAFHNFDLVNKKVGGFEANGGFLLASQLHQNRNILSPLPTRDAVLPFLSLMKLAKEKCCSISSLQAMLPKRYTDADRLTNFPRELSLSIILKLSREPSLLIEALNLPDVKSMNNVDGLRLAFKDDTIIHLRPSGNAPELRCYVETNSEEASNDLLKKVLDRELLKNL